jgi:membrane fusion protein (multidrug efflux system)
MELLRVNIARTEIRAPFDGRLGLRNISLGAYITPQTIISNIAQVNNIKVEFAVPEQYAAEMQAGKTVSFRSTYGGKTFTAQVIAAQNSIELSSRNLMVRARVLNPDKTIAPGSFVQVSIQVGENGAAIMIPTQAVLPSTRNKTVIVSENGVAAIRTVVTGFRDSARVEIINGISKGDTILINGLLTIKPGMPVKTRVAPR